MKQEKLFPKILWHTQALSYTQNYYQRTHLYGHVHTIYPYGWSGWMAGKRKKKLKLFKLTWSAVEKTTKKNPITVHFYADNIEITVKRKEKKTKTNSNNRISNAKKKKCKLHDIQL